MGDVQRKKKIKRICIIIIKQSIINSLNTRKKIVLTRFPFFACFFFLYNLQLLIIIITRGKCRMEEVVEEVVSTVKKSPGSYGQYLHQYLCIIYH